MSRFTNFISQTNPAVTRVDKFLSRRPTFRVRNHLNSTYSFHFNMFNVFMLKVYRILLKINLATDVLIIIAENFPNKYSSERYRADAFDSYLNPF